MTLTLVHSATSRLGNTAMLDRILADAGVPLPADPSNNYKLPLYASKVPAGAPFSGDEGVEKRISLNDLLLQNPGNSFLLRVSGDSMTRRGIGDNDLLIVDRYLPAKNGDVVVASVDGHTTVKTIQQDKNGILLKPENRKYKPIEIGPETNFLILGVVLHVVKQLY